MIWPTTVHRPCTQAAAAAQQTATALSAEAEQWRQLRNADETKAAQAGAGAGGSVDGPWKSLHPGDFKGRWGFSDQTRWVFDGICTY